MALQRKIFRIEEMSRGAALPAMPVAAAKAAPGHAEIVIELRELRSLLSARPAAGAQPGGNPPPQAREARKLKIELDVIGEAIRQTKTEIATLQDRGFDGARVARVAHELDAVVGGAEQATQRILNAAEEIEQSANMLAASAKSEHQQGLAQDIADQVTQIFEACNFHDLTGQRIAKAVATMKLVEDHIARMMEIWSVIEKFNAAQAAPSDPAENALPNGPKVTGETGHSSQDEIDALFH